MYLDSLNSGIYAETIEANLKKLNLTNCDREPIHKPNLIQPHGLLFAVSADKYHILQVSVNTLEVLRRKPQDLLDKPLAELLGEEQVRAIKGCLEEEFENINPVPIEIVCGESILTFDGIVHRNGEVVILELEPNKDVEEIKFFNFYKSVKSSINKIHKTNTLDELCQTISKEIKKITGFDRVMVYRFDSEGSGTVIAEAVEAELTPYLGLHYPATDIPQQARYLFTIKSLRFIPDVTYEEVAIVPEINPLTNEGLDMSMSVLRSVSPFHIEYLNNMGVAATLVISLVKNKQLWGLISCHHNKPKEVPYEIRTMCEFMGEIVSLELATKENNQDLEYKMKLKSIQSKFVETLSVAQDLETGLAENSTDLLDLVSATGVALSFGEEIKLIGDTPEKEDIRVMLPWIEKQFKEEIIYQTNSIGTVYFVENQETKITGGLLVLLISRVEKTFIIWFRPEVIQTVNWAGNPNQPIEKDPDGNILLSPRTSFAIWQETVKGKSLPWKNCEVEAAIELRSSIVSILLRKAEELTQVNKQLARSNVELDSFAYIASHDLKEPLRGIYNYSSFLIEDYGEILDKPGIDKLNTLMKLTHRMEDLINSLLHYSRLGRLELEIRPVDLNQLLAEVLEVVKVSARDRSVEFKIPRPLPKVNCDRSQVNELFTNLITNGIKYNEEIKKIIEIGYLDNDDPLVISKMREYATNTEQKTIFYVKDNGIGIREKHLESVFLIFKRLHGQKKYGGGTGAGLTIAKKIAERHGGDLWVRSVYQKGSTFYFSL